MNATTASTQTPGSRWYHEPMTWLVFGGPAVVVVAAIVTAFIAWNGADGVVAEDYYKRGLQVNEQVGRVRQAEALQLGGRLTFDGTASGDSVRLVLRSGSSAPLDPALKVRLVHPGRAALDREALMARRGVTADGAAEYIGSWQTAAELPTNARANWQVVIESRDWRMDADLGVVDANGRVVAPDASAAGVVNFPAQARHP